MGVDNKEEKLKKCWVSILMLNMMAEREVARLWWSGGGVLVAAVALVGLEWWCVLGGGGEVMPIELVGGG